MDLEAIKYIAAGLTVMFGIMPSAIGEGKIGVAAMEAMGRNPSAGAEMFPRMIVAMAITESPAIFAFVMGIIILFS